MADFNDIHSKMTMGEVLEIFPGAQPMLHQRYHIGGCSGCGFEPTETVAQVCERNNILDPEEMVAFLKEGAKREGTLMVSTRTVQEWIEAEADLELIDIRPPQEFNLVRLAQAKLATQELVDEILTRWPKERKFVLIDHDGSRAPDTVRRLRNVGFENAFAVRGGLDAWSQEIDPLFPRY